MKKRDWLLNLSVIGLLWFSLAFACNKGDDRSSGKPTQSGGTTTRTENGDAPTEQDVKNAIEKFINNGNDERSVESLKNLKVTFDTPINIGASFQYDYPHYGLTTVYPARVDYTSRGEDADGNTHIAYYEGYTVYISKNEYGEWEYGTQVNGHMSFDHINRK